MNVASHGSAARSAAIPATLPAEAPAVSPWVEDVNLARRPFGNSRPVVRAALLLWLLGAALLAANVSSFWTYLVASEDKRAQLDKTQEEILRQQETVRKLDQRLAAFDLRQMNDRIEFLNRKIAERTFSWSELLDHVARALPNDVRLNRLTPLTGSKAGQNRTGRTARQSVRSREGEVTLVMTGETRDDDALLRFVDNLFEPPFRDPNPTRESRQEDSDRVSFEVTVHYSAARSQESPGVTVEEVPAGPPGTPAAAPPAEDQR